MSKVFSYDDVAKHKKSGDAWLVINGNVYDVSKFLDEHPGGEEVLLDMAGKEATREYDDVGHSNEADQLMKQYLIGTVDPASAKAHAGAKKAPLSAAPAGSGGAKAGGSAGIVTYALPLVLLLALFVAAKFFKVL